MEITTAFEGPPPGVNRRGRWVDVHFQLQAAAPGQWVVIKKLDYDSAKSLRSALSSKSHTVTTRQQPDGTTEVWALREALAFDESHPVAEREPQLSHD